MCDLLHNWGRPFVAEKHNLVSVLQEVYRLYKSAPPLPLEELFGTQPESRTNNSQFEQEHSVCKELDFAKCVLNKKVVIQFAQTKMLLTNKGSDDACIVGESADSEDAQWVITPAANGS